MPRLFGDQWRSGLRMFRCGNKNVQQVSPHLICLSARHPHCSFVRAVFTCRWHLIGLMSEQVVDCIFTHECVLTWWEDFSLFHMSAFCLTRPSHFFTSLEITFDFLVYEPFIKKKQHYSLPALCLPVPLHLPLYLFIYIWLPFVVIIYWHLSVLCWTYLLLSVLLKLISMSHLPRSDHVITDQFYSWKTLPILDWSLKVSLKGTVQANPLRLGKRKCLDRKPTDKNLFYLCFRDVRKVMAGLPT